MSNGNSREHYLKQKDFALGLKNNAGHHKKILVVKSYMSNVQLLSTTAVDGMSNDLSVPHQMSSVFLATKKVLQSSVTQSSLSIISRLKSTLNADVIIKAQALNQEVVANAVTAKGSGGWWHAAATRSLSLPPSSQLAANTNSTTSSPPRKWS